MPLSVSLRRLGYRLAYRVLQVVWWVTRPSQTGVKCVVSAGDRVLLVRHTYGSRAWDLPGGMAKRREAPPDTARREMAEELGIDRDDWTPLGVIRGRMAHRRDTIHLYGIELGPALPDLSLDPGELDVAEFFPRRDLPRPMAMYAGAVLAHVPSSAGLGG